MKIRLLISRSGPAGTHKPGDVIEVSEREAKRLMEANPAKAVPVRDADDVETTAAPPAGRKRKKG